MSISYRTHVHATRLGADIVELLPNVFLLDGQPPQFLPKFGRKIWFSLLHSHRGEHGNDLHPRSLRCAEDADRACAVLSESGDELGNVDVLVEQLWPAISNTMTKPPELFAQFLTTVLMHGWKDLLGVPILDTLKLAHNALSECFPLDLESSKQEALELVWLHRIRSLAFQHSGRRVDRRVFHSWGLSKSPEGSWAGEEHPSPGFSALRALEFIQRPGETLPDMMARLADDPINKAVLKVSALASLACSPSKRSHGDLDAWVDGSDLRQLGKNDCEFFYDSWEKIALCQTEFDSEVDQLLVRSVFENLPNARARKGGSLERDVYSEDLFRSRRRQKKVEDPAKGAPDIIGAGLGELSSLRKVLETENGGRFGAFPPPYHPQRAALIVAKIYEKFFSNFGLSWGELDETGSVRVDPFSQARNAEDLAKSIDSISAFLFVSHYLQRSYPATTAVYEEEFIDCLGNALAVWARRFTDGFRGLSAMERCPTVIWALIAPFTYADGMLLGNPVSGFDRDAGPGNYSLPLPGDMYKKGWYGKIEGASNLVNVNDVCGEVGDVVSAAWEHMGKHESTIQLTFKGPAGTSMKISLVQIADQLVTIASSGDTIFFSRQRAAHGAEYAGFRTEQQIYWSDDLALPPNFKQLNGWVDSTKPWNLVSVEASRWISPVFLFPHKKVSDQDLEAKLFEKTADQYSEYYYVSYFRGEGGDDEVWARVTLPEGSSGQLGDGLPTVGQTTSQKLFRFLDMEHQPYFREIEHDELIGAIESLAHRSGRHVILKSVLNSDRSPIIGSTIDAFIDNPLLGEPWVPVFLGLERIVNRLTQGSFFTLSIWPHSSGVGDDRTAYCQVMKEEDGSLHLEVGPTTMFGRLNPEFSDAMTLLGWKEPEDAALPNFFRVFREPFVSAEVVTAALETLVTMFQVSTADAFEVAGFAEGEFNCEGLLDEVFDVEGVRPGVLYGLPGLHSFPSVFNLERDLTERWPEQVWEQVLSNVTGNPSDSSQTAKTPVGVSDDNYLNPPVAQLPADFTLSQDTLFVALVNPDHPRAVMELGAIVKPKNRVKAPKAFIYRDGWVPSKYFSYALLTENPPKLVSLTPAAALNIIGQFREFGGSPSPQELKVPLEPRPDEVAATTETPAVAIEPLVRLGPDGWWRWREYFNSNEKGTESVS